MGRGKVEEYGDSERWKYMQSALGALAICLELG